MNVISRVGSAISRNREEAKTILTSHNLTFGEGKNSDLILAAFKAIKAGNSALALDLAGLIQLEKGKKSGVATETLLANIKAKVDAAKADKVPAIVADDTTGNVVIDTAAVVTSNAEGDSDELLADATELTDTIATGDPVVLAGEAEESSDMTKTILYVAALVAVAVGILWLMKKYWK